METFIYLQRHGESEANISKIFACRRIDPFITEKGRSQIINKAVYYQDKNIARMVSSPSRRTIQTAEIIAKKLNISFSTDENLLEVNVGDLEGRSELENNNMDYFYSVIKKWADHDQSISFPNGENAAGIEKRINHIIQKYFHLNENIILVGHCSLYAILLSRYIKTDNILDLFLKRGSAIRYSRTRKFWEFLE